ncbi:Three-deoxy-D-manno-octulosonic-acid transferase domain protein [Methylocella silvestris BL2]|uniref:3-deoxy-D-manno-octulosonic acid transferase n=1 Tax=Methylocella silvestris (strain DSM 15510 / CIP 108128 / LMG 27833 / NCIMB 13906 / BL2) TaxID=395965 RepID=B8EL60_METSB|nr:glycosyltransferase N-terminal domain-containing protein [Methylocella silvestris]ACK49055.1 Three-deoxy-D-manno-octulosonic-acid transferase domain protein [Methylocella silvestris BL2]
MLLSLYRACSAAFAPLAPLVLWWRVRLRGGRSRQDERRIAAERLGSPSAARPQGRLVWVAAATAIDATRLLPLIDRLAAAGFHVLVTTRDDEAAPPRLPPFALHQYAPLDVPKFAARFLASWRPDVALLDGAEFWPNLTRQMRRRGVPVALVDAHLSARAFALLSRAPKLARALLSGFEACLARSAADMERLRHLGAGYAQIVGDPAYDLSPEPADSAALALLSARIGARPVWAAFTADQAEADVVLDAHRKIAAKLPGVLTIIAPRRAKSAIEIALRASKLGLDARAATASAGDEALPAILILAGADAGTLYRAAGVVFLGRSLGDAISRSLGVASGGGGLNPIEAAKLGCAILRGPEVSDFADSYETLDRAGGCALVHDAESLAAEVTLLLFDAAELRAMGRAAAEEVERLSGASTRIMQALSPFLAQVFLRPGVEDEAES